MPSDSSEIAIAAFDWQPGEHAEVVGILNQAQFRTPAWRAAKWVAGLFLGGTFLTVAYQAWVFGDFTTLSAALPWLLFVAFWFYIFRVLRGRGIGQPTVNQEVHYPIVHRFTNEGLDIAMASSRLQLKWSGMTKVSEEPGYFLFYWNSRCAYYTPKRALPIEAQNRLREMASQKLGADAHVGELLSLPEPT